MLLRFTSFTFNISIFGQLLMFSSERVEDSMLIHLILGQLFKFKFVVSGLPSR